MSVNRALAAAAVVLAGLAPFAGSPPREAGLEPGRMRVLDLAERLRDRRAVRVIDLRDSVAFAEFNLPRAVRVSPGDLARLDLSSADTVVLYDGGDGTARRAWADLRDGPAAVYWLRDAVTEWVDEIMNPVLAPDATPGEREAFAPVAELSRYFGGMPRVSAPPGADSASARERFERTVRRGCAF